MKRILILMFAVSLGLAVNAQKYYYLPSADTIKGDTNYIPTSSGYDLKNIQSGVFSYTFTHTDVTDSLSIARLEGRDATTDTWVPLTGNAALTLTTTNGSSKIYVSTPILYRYMRAMLACASGDTVAVSKQTLMLKED